MRRQYNPYLTEYWDKKIILISGPRQVGKTTLAKQLPGEFQYLNFDNEDHREILKEKSWDRSVDFLILDEIHKMKDWKLWLKGIYDVEGLKPKIVVTGSAKMNTYRKAGDSLAGRYLHYRIHPFDIKELERLKFKSTTNNFKSITDQLLNLGGFPEPFLEEHDKFYTVWKKTHLDIILRQDILFEEDIKNMRAFSFLIDLLKQRVGSAISYKSLSEDLSVSDKTIKRWLNILEDIYVVFKVKPYFENITKSVRKKPKYYFYDIPRVKDFSFKIENLVGASLLKECHFRQDCLGEDWELFYLSKQGQTEVDFLITHNSKPKIMVEVKTKDSKLSKQFNLFKKDLAQTQAIQVCYEIKQEKTFPDKSEIRNIENWLKKW